MILPSEVLKRLAGAREIVIVPQGALGMVPFAALFRLDTLTEPMRQLVRITVAAAAELARAARNLRKFGDPESIKGPTLAVHTLENEADAVYRAAVEALFAGATDPRELVRQKDMLFALEAGVDACEDAMDVIRSVVVKNG